MTETNTQLIFPYVSYPAFKAFIGHLNDTVVTDQIDNTMMPNNFSGSVRTGVTSALKSLSLINEQGNTTVKLKELTAAYNSKNWPVKIREHVLSAYDGVVGDIELKSATRKQIDNMFEGASSQMREKYIRFFLSANKDAGVGYSPHLKIRKRSLSPKKRVSTKPSAKNNSAKTADTQENNTKPIGSFDQPIPIASEFPCFIRIPLNINSNQVALVEAAVAFIKAMANQNKESK